MPGYNHHESCTCGWCVKTASNKPSAGHLRTYPALDSLTIPNAKCPFCGANVFYYSNSYGSSVYFDELGPPWPKHPCTDITYTPRPNPHGSSGDFNRSNEGWLVYRYIRTKFEDDWIALHLERINDRIFTRVLIQNFLRIPNGHPIYMKTFDRLGYTTIQFIDDNLTISETLGWEYQHYYMVSASDAILERNLRPSRASF